MTNALRKPEKCYSCGQGHATDWLTGYYWKAEPAHNRFWPEAYNVWAIEECGALANTEAVATFVGKYHDAKKNSEESVGTHNTALLKRVMAMGRQSAIPVRNLIGPTQGKPV